MIGFEFAIVRLEIFEGPAVVAKFFPVIQVLLRCHTNEQVSKLSI